jgi:hypothetical protein
MSEKVALKIYIREHLVKISNIYGKYSDSLASYSKALRRPLKKPCRDLLCYESSRKLYQDHPELDSGNNPTSHRVGI